MIAPSCRKIVLQTAKSFFIRVSDNIIPHRLVLIALVATSARIQPHPYHGLRHTNALCVFPTHPAQQHPTLALRSTRIPAGSTDRHFWKYARHGCSHYDGHRPYHAATFQPFRAERSRQRRQHLTFNENYGALALRPLPPNCCFPAVRHLLLYRIFQLLQLDFSAYQYRWFNSTDYAVLHRLGADKKKALMTHTII